MDQKQVRRDPTMRPPLAKTATKTRKPSPFPTTDIGAAARFTTVSITSGGQAAIEAEQAVEEKQAIEKTIAEIKNAAAALDNVKGDVENSNRLIVGSGAGGIDSTASSSTEAAADDGSFNSAANDETQDDQPTGIAGLERMVQNTWIRQKQEKEKERRLWALLYESHGAGIPHDIGIMTLVGIVNEPAGFDILHYAVKMENQRFIRPQCARIVLLGQVPGLDLFWPSEKPPPNHINKWVKRFQSIRPDIRVFIRKIPSTTKNRTGKSEYELGVYNSGHYHATVAFLGILTISTTGQYRQVKLPRLNTQGLGDFMDTIVGVLSESSCEVME